MDGRHVPRLSPAGAHTLGIRAIYQQPALFPDLTIAENIALSIEPLRALSRVDWMGRRRRARELLAQVGARLDVDAAAGRLSMPEQQLVEIAKAIGANARIVIMDEPTAALTGQEVEKLFNVVRRLRESGVAVIYISHRLEEVFALADRITILRDGRSVATRSVRDVSSSELVSLMVGREVATIFAKRDVPIGDLVLEIEHVTNAAAGLRDVSLRVRAGEIVGIAGLVGSGRTELAETLFGLSPADTGTIRMRGKTVVIRSPRDAIAAGIGFVPEDRRRHGVLQQMSIAPNVSLASLAAVARGGLIRPALEEQLAATYIDALRVKTPSAWTLVGELSGGNQQKIALARWLARRPSLLILDEPTQGVDVGSKSQIHALMQDLAEQGLAILMISSEMSEVLGMSDRVAVMRAGTLAGVLSRPEATQERVLGLALSTIH